MKTIYLAFSGVMGSGKTTATRLLAPALGWEAVEEQVDDNPFLARFYQDSPRWAFASEMYFLISKIEQLFMLKKRFANSNIVGDTPIYQDVFSYAKTQHELGHLAHDEWEAYTKLFRAVEHQLPQPQLIVYLQTSLAQAWRRITKRNRPYEAEIKREHIAKLMETNEEWLRSLGQRVHVLTINTDKLDFVHLEADRRTLITQIQKTVRTNF